MTTGSTFYEAEHAGAHAAATKLDCRIYWNAPTHENDIEGQVRLLERVATSHRYRGLVLAPDHAIAMLAPVRRVLDAGIPTVVIVSPLALPAGGNLSYIVTDEELAGRMAAVRIGQVLQGRGSVAVVGIDPGVAGIMLRLRSFEGKLEAAFPDIHISFRGAGAFNAAEAQQAIIAALSADRKLGAVFSLTTVSTRAAFFALKSAGLAGQIRLLGCDQDIDMIKQVRLGAIDSILAQDTYRMGSEAVQQVVARLHHHAVPGSTILPPVLVTRENAGSPEVAHLLDMTWFARED